MVCIFTTILLFERYPLSLWRQRPRKDGPESPHLPSPTLSSPFAHGEQQIEHVGTRRGQLCPYEV